VWVDPPGQQPGWTGGPESEPPRLGETGIARPGLDPARITVQEVVYGREEALRRWLDLDTGARLLAIVSTGPDGLRDAQAHATVRAYTAASYSGRPQEARRIRDAFPAPARALTALRPGHRLAPRLHHRPAGRR
jgi:hypothetical protein